MPVSVATTEDIRPLVILLNNAYRGEGSKKGWTSEADMVSGELRTNVAAVKELMQLPGAIFLKYTNDADKMEGCVFLQKKNKKLYLGMLSVAPLLQAKGIGKQIMTAAEQYARQQECKTVFMRVISIRHELIAWYERQGYYKTGEVQPFEDSEFGKAKKPIEFVVMQKIL